jgi:dihydrofolate reductase
VRVAAYIACSLDGFIAENDGGLDWLTGIPNEDGSDYGFAEFMRCVDAVLMGRKTFETVLEFGEWPYEKPVFVMSGTLTRVPAIAEGKAEIVRGGPRDALRVLMERGIETVYVDGGRTIQGFLKEDLVDSLTVTTVSKILGGGIPLFGEIGRALNFRLIDTERLNEQLVKNRYERI